jgi:hypothetical protein
MTWIKSIDIARPAVDAAMMLDIATTLRICIIKLLRPRSTMSSRPATVDPVDETPPHQQTLLGITCSNMMPQKGKATLKVLSSSDRGDPDLGFPWNILAGGRRS